MNHSSKHFPIHLLVTYLWFILQHSPRLRLFYGYYPMQCNSISVILTCNCKRLSIDHEGVLPDDGPVRSKICKSLVFFKNKLL